MIARNLTRAHRYKTAPKVECYNFTFSASKTLLKATEVHVATMKLLLNSNICLSANRDMYTEIMNKGHWPCCIERFTVCYNRMGVRELALFAFSNGSVGGYTDGSNLSDLRQVKLNTM